MLRKLPWPDKVKVWEMYYLQETPIDRIRSAVKLGGYAPSWETVKQVVLDFLSLSPSQVTILPSPLQARWREVAPQGDARQQETKQIVNGGTKDKLDRFAGQEWPQGTSRQATLVESRLGEHWNRLCDITKSLPEYIRCPNPANIFLWDTSSPQRYPIFQRKSMEYVWVTESVFVQLEFSEGKCKATPEIENTDDWKFLWPHLQAETQPAVAEDYAIWKESIGCFFAQCHACLKSVEDKAKKEIKKAAQEAGIPTGLSQAQRRGEQGVRPSFYEDIYSLAFGGADWDHAKLERKPSVGRPEHMALWRTNRDVTVETGAVIDFSEKAPWRDRGLAIGTGVEIDICEEASRSLSKAAIDWPQVKQLLGTYRVCREMSKGLRFKLSTLEKRGQFNGDCDICRPLRYHHS